MDVTFERGPGVPIPDGLVVDVAELDAPSGTILEERRLELEGATFFAMEGDTNRVLAVAGDDAGALSMAAVANDAAGAAIATGFVEIPREDGVAIATVVLMSSAPGDAGSDTGTDAGTDVGLDSGSDTGSDMGSDASSDVGMDSGSDAGTDSAMAVCGDGVSDPPEECDGADVGMNNCTTVGMFSGGTLACDGTCMFDVSMCLPPPSTPVLRRPLNNSYVGSVHVSGSLRPEFEWEASTVAGGSPMISYELTYGTDPSLMAGVTMQITPALTFQPAMDLVVSTTAPVGNRIYWQVRACAGSACSPPSPIWWVNVGRSNKDFNGDGYADLAVGSLRDNIPGIDAGRVHLHLGSPAGPSLTADLLFSGDPTETEFGASVSYADLNADGFADLVVGAYEELSNGAGEAFVLLGGTGAGPGGDATADLMLNGDATGDFYGYDVAGVGDVNGDGFDDFVVGARYYDGAVGTDSGRAYLYYGGPALDATPDALLEANATDGEFGVAVAGGDVNGDGLADVAVGARSSSLAGATSGAVYLYFGSNGPFSVTPGLALAGLDTSSAAFGSAVAVGDVNDDGFCDIIGGAELDDTAVANAGAAYLFLGSGVPDAMVDASLFGDGNNDRSGNAIAISEDVNGDGFRDVVIGAFLDDPGGEMDAGSASVYFGGAGGLSATADGFLAPGLAGDLFANRLGAPGDLDGDGLGDIVIGVNLDDEASVNAGAAYLYYGMAGVAFDETFDLKLLGLASGDNFGFSIASLLGAAEDTGLLCLPERVSL